MPKYFLIIVTCLYFFQNSYGQDALPAFSVINKGNNRILISWKNNYGTTIKQLSIQRSFDSLKNFKTIATIPDPTIPQNGLMDTKAINDHMFYRLYILLDSGKYIFSNSQKPQQDLKVVTKPNEPDVAIVETKKPEKEDAPKNIIKPKEEVIIPEKFIYVKRRDTLIATISEKIIKKYKDSINTKSKDTLVFIATDTLLIKPFVPKEIYKPSKYVFTDKNGEVRIILPEAANQKYLLKFFEMDDSPLFEIKNIKEPQLTISRENFIHAGWFKFELHENGTLKEKHKFFIAKPF